MKSSQLHHKSHLNAVENRRKKDELHLDYVELQDYIEIIQIGTNNRLISRRNLPAGLHTGKNAADED